MPAPEKAAETVPVDRLGGLLDRQLGLAPCPAYPGLVIRAGYMESA